MPKPSNPVELFSSLELKPTGQIRGLWNSQKEVLEKYYNELMANRRIAIELPTGSGKSIIGLLILEMWRRTGKRVAILTSSIALSEDMERRCQDLGLESVVITGKRGEEKKDRERVRKIKRYKRQQAIGIMNYWAYLLGRDIVEADVLVIDDADSFENLLIDHYSVVISRKEDEDMYDQIWSDLHKHRVYEKLEAFGFRETRPEDVQLIYFLHAFKMVDKIKKLVHSKGRDGVSKDLYWDFDNNGKRMHTYLMFVSKDTITLTPYIAPGSMHGKTRNVDQIIYMSATLGTSEMIHKSMGSFAEISILSENDLDSAIGTMGRRIIFPIDGISTTLGIAEEAMAAILKIMSEFRKALVFCNSHYDAHRVEEALRENGHTTIIYKEEKDSRVFSRIDEGVLITAGRFIGLDLPEETCRVAIMTKMPYVLSPTDALTKDILEDADYTNEKVSHRMVQAFGRCNRSPTDYAIYFMLDSTLASDILGEEKVFRHFPSHMKAEIDYGQEFTDDGNLSMSVEIGAKLLQGRLPDFEAEVTKRLSTDDTTTNPVYERPYREEIQGWYDLTERQNYLDAIKHFSGCIEFLLKQESIDDSAKRRIAWLYYLIAKNYYLCFEYFKKEEYKELTIENLSKAIDYGYTSWFSGLQTLVAELSETKMEDDEIVFDLHAQAFKERTIRSWIEFKRANSSRKRNPQQTWENMRETLLSGTHNAVCSVLKQVLELVGFEVRDHRNEEGKPDLVAFSNATKERYLCMIEVKTRETGDNVVRKDVDQISGNRTVYQREYPDHTVYALLFTNKEGHSSTAIEKARNDVRLLRSIEFASFMNAYYELMERGWSLKHPSERLALTEKVPSLDRFQTIFMAQDDPTVELEDFNSLVE